MRISPEAFGVPGSIRNEIHLQSSPGNGSTGTATRVFSTVNFKSGNAFTYKSDPVNGDSIVIDVSGFYSTTYCDYSGSAGAIMGITVNSSDSTTSPDNLTYAQGKRALTATSSTSHATALTWSGFFKKGDVVRAQNSSSMVSNDAVTMLSMVKIS